MTHTLTELLRRITTALGDSHPPVTAWWLLEALTNKRRAVLSCSEQVALSVEQEEQLAEWLRAIEQDRKPVQYILGSVPFLTADIAVRPPTLIPRVETEEWVERLITRLKACGSYPSKILDLCTGSGCIAVALAQAFPQTEVIAADINPQAVLLARENAQRNDCSNITVIESDLFDAIEQGPFDLIVSNPPYIPTSAYDRLDPSVKEWEDKIALEAGEDGLSVIRQLVTQAPTQLKPNRVNGPSLMIEVDETHADMVVDLLRQQGFTTTVEHDSFGKQRVVHGTLQQTRTDHNHIT